MKKKNHLRRDELGMDSRPSPTARKRPGSPDEVSTSVVVLARIIREAYVEARSAWETVRRGVRYEYVVPKSYDAPTRPPKVDGVAVEGGSDKPSVWVTMARKFLQQEIDAEDYVYRLFERGDKKRAPEPAQLLDRNFLAHYQDARALEAEEVANSLDIQKQLCAANVTYWRNSGIDFVQAHSFVLTDESLELSALFRLCLASTLVDRDAVFGRIVKSYGKEAALQFQQNREEYKNTWGDFIPPDFVKRSRRIYEKSLRDAAGDWDAEEG